METHPHGHYVIEVDYAQQIKYQQHACGDSFFSTKIRDENRTISVLSDGLGSGVKANVLSTLTAVMAARFTSGYRDVKRTAEIIMQTLPICKERKISYATFTIIDIDGSGMARILEYDNPSVVIIRDQEIVPVEFAIIEGEGGARGAYTLRYLKFPIQYGDRIICFSDGVTQSGIGMQKFPLGWGWEKAAVFLQHTIAQNPLISARDLTRKLVQQAMLNDANKALDDITCGIVSYRQPRELLIVTGPPVDRAKDQEMAQRVKQHQGRTIICGGTTANLLARELNRPIRLDLSKPLCNAPPASFMEGIDLVTEGIITLQRVADLLKESGDAEPQATSPARQVVDLMLDSDLIRFVVGTRINDAYQDPHLPQEIALRRTIIREILHHLESKHLKETQIQYI